VKGDAVQDRKQEDGAGDGERLCPWVDCPVVKQAGRVASISEDLVGALKDLKRGLKHCHGCRLQNRCEFRLQYNVEVRLAIQQVAGEWGLL
jgi:hypothetical protein